MRKRLRPEDRRQQILDAAIRVAEKPGGWTSLTREMVAREAGIVEGSVSRYFGTMVAFRRSIMRACVAYENLSVVMQGLASGDKYALRAGQDLKARAVQTLCKGKTWTTSPEN